MSLEQSVEDLYQKNLVLQGDKDMGKWVKPEWCKNDLDCNICIHWSSAKKYCRKMTEVIDANNNSNIDNSDGSREHN